MSNTNIQPERPNVPRVFAKLEDLQARHKVSYGLLGLGLIGLILFFVLLIRMGWVDGPYRIYLLLMAILFAFVGTWIRLDTGTSGTKPADSLRMQLLTLGGGIGFFTALLGLSLALTTYSTTFAGGLAVWRAKPWQVLQCLVLFLVGLSMMFLTLLLGRTIERTNVGVRRAVYGYNAVLTGLLLLTILGLINVLCYVPWGPFKYLNGRWDWTASQIYSLSPATRNFLVNLEKPVKVYVLLNPSDLVGQDVETMLANCKTVTNKLTSVSLSRDLNRSDLQKLIDQYQVADSFGLLVVYGTSPSEQHEFIRREDLAVDDSTRDRSGDTQKGRYIFKGEGALMKALNFLAEDKKKAVVYFTQGNGEPSLSSSFGEGRFTQGLTQLKERLTRGNYEVKPLDLKPGVDKVPPDADVVVVANPRLGLPDSAVKGLTEYMNPSGAGKKGKLIVLQDVVLNSERSKMATTGLEALLRQYNVNLGQERLLAPKENPSELLVIPNPRSRNPIAQAFFSEGQVSVFRFEDARTVEGATPEGPPGRTPYKVEPLLLTLPRMPVWKETNFSDPTVLVENLLTPEREDELRKKISPQPLSVAVAVAETDSSVPRDMAHANVSGKDEVPRMIVFGDASWITDQSMSTRVGKLNADLFASSVAWLRGRSNLGEQKDDTNKTRQEFTLAGSVTPDKAARIRYLPMALMVLGIFGLGGGIWLIRRR